MNRCCVLLLLLILGGAVDNNKVKIQPKKEEATLSRLVRLVVFVLGIVTALIEIVIYAKSLKPQNVVTFEVFGGHQEAANDKQVRGAGQSDRVIGPTRDFQKSEQEMYKPQPQNESTPNSNKNIDDIAKQMFRDAEESLSARARRKRKVQNINLNKSHDNESPA